MGYLKTRTDFDQRPAARFVFLNTLNKLREPHKEVRPKFIQRGKTGSHPGVDLLRRSWVTEYYEVYIDDGSHPEVNR